MSKMVSEWELLYSADSISYPSEVVYTAIAVSQWCYYRLATSSGPCLSPTCVMKNFLNRSWLYSFLPSTLVQVFQNSALIVVDQNVFAWRFHALTSPSSHGIVILHSMYWGSLSICSVQILVVSVNGWDKCFFLACFQYVDKLCKAYEFNVCHSDEDPSPIWQCYRFLPIC